MQSRARSLLPPPRRPQIRSALAAGDPKHIVEGPAQEITAAARSANVVLTDRNDIRFSHPNLALIDHKLEEPVAALDGKTHLGSTRAGHVSQRQAPIFGADGSGDRLGVGGIEVTKVLDNPNIWLITGS